MSTEAPDTSPSKEFPCRDCGAIVHRRTSKRTGKRYTAEYFEWMVDSFSAQNQRTNQRTLYRGHNCTPDPAWRERAEMAEQQRVANATNAGRIEKGVRIVVARGRKVPKGTTGVVFWVAPEKDGYGNIRAGITDDAGNKHFINIQNLDVEVA